MIKYVFPFCFPAKERERARCYKGKASVYSPTSTKKFYLKIRTYIIHHYPHYTKQIVDYNCKVSLLFGTTKANDNDDIDNKCKNIDSLMRDRGRKENTGFIGVFKDDKYIKHINAQLVYVENPEDEFTVLIIEPYEPPVVEGGIEAYED